MRTLKMSLVLAVMVGCGPGTRDPGMGGPGPGGTDGGDMGNANCSDSAKLVYTVDENNTLSQFDPSTKTFHDLGTLACPTTGSTPFSMGVDRNTVAWVLYQDGTLYRVDILNGLACTKTGWASSNGLVNFGMGFSTNTAGSTDDTLFISGGAGPMNPTSTLASLDTSSMLATTHGMVMGWPELTGNANAELWGWFPTDSTGTSTPRVEQIDKTSGAPIKTYPLPTLTGSPIAWAFAYWGGDYWVFLAKDLDFSTSVYQIDGSNGSIKSTTPTQTRMIVGAGVSTCAPTVIF